MKHHQCDVFITNLLSYYDEVKDNNEIQIHYIEDLLQIITLCCTPEYQNKRILIFFDEIFSVVEKSGALKRDVLTFLSQCRKRGIVLITTCQEWSELHITFRRYVRFQINCSMKSYFNKAIVINEINDGDTIRWDSLSNDYISDRLQTNIRKGLKSVIEKYDTLETIKNTNLLNVSRSRF